MLLLCPTKICPAKDFEADWKYSEGTTVELLGQAGSGPKVKVLLRRECEDESTEAKGQKSLPFGGKAGKAEASSGLGRHAFYRAHKLQRVTAF